MTKPNKKSKTGMSFLMMVLLTCPVLVAVTGIVAALAVPAFAGYIKESKASEATSNLQSIYTGAASYYQVERAGAAGTERNCTVSPARSTNAPTAERSAVNWATEDAAFTELAFNPVGATYYQYEIAGAPGRCAHPANSSAYSLRAHGDLDADGQLSLFELAVGSDANNELYRSPAFSITDELE